MPKYDKLSSISSNQSFLLSLKEVAKVLNHVEWGAQFLHWMRCPNILPYPNSSPNQAFQQVPPSPSPSFLYFFLQLFFLSFLPFLLTFLSFFPFPFLLHPFLSSFFPSFLSFSSPFISSFFPFFPSFLLFPLFVVSFLYLFSLLPHAGFWSLTLASIPFSHMNKSEPGSHPSFQDSKHLS